LYSILRPGSINRLIVNNPKLKIVHGHCMVPVLQHVCNGLVRLAEESMLARNNGTLRQQEIVIT